MQPRRTKIFFLLSFLLVSFTSGAAHAEDVCDDSGKIYKICADQASVARDALAAARVDKKFVLFKFGAEWCPWCKSLHKLLRSPEFERDFGARLTVVEVGLYKGKEKLPNGYAVLDQIVERAGTKRPEKFGFPYLVLVDPLTNQVAFQATGELEDNSKGKGHNPELVKAALNRLMDSLAAKR